MDFNIKRHNLSLSDEEAPFYRFINSRKSLQDLYNNNKRHITLQNLNKNKYYSNEKDKKIKNNISKGHSVNLLKGQIFIISHFSNLAKRNKGNDFNYDYNNSLLNTFGNRNFFFKRNNIKVNMLSKISNDNYFLKTSFKKYSNKKINPSKKQKINSDTINLPKLNFIIKKSSKNDIILYK